MVVFALFEFTNDFSRFEDFLNRKEYSVVPEVGFNHTMHDVLERKLGWE